MQGRYNQYHSKFDKTARTQCFCNTLLVVYWKNFSKLSCWNGFDLDFVLDLADNLFKRLGFHRYLDASDLAEHIRFHGSFMGKVLSVQILFLIHSFHTVEVLHCFL